MRDFSDKNFGIAIAYLIPGFAVLIGASEISPTVSGWLGSGGASGDPTVGRFLYVLLASLAAGLVVSALRWAAIDSIHHATGIEQPHLDFSRLGPKIEPFMLIVESNYRFYQFYANLFVALPFTAACRFASGGEKGNTWLWATGILTEAVLFAGSRDSLRRYYERAAALLGAERRGIQDSADFDE
jgi:hypothetical protein